MTDDAADTGCAGRDEGPDVNALATRYYTDPNFKLDTFVRLEGVAKYWAFKHTCQACPSKLKRCLKADCR
ncbi:hypothetical protein [Roseobacter sp.]|uniref:hypothetical protein n=1 Tax=Roseobacter sp. TaxID=1907202 RepID=UPI00385B2CCE